ncbi:ABC transporter substrate-binding protein, partial [Bordetella hinzii]|nr:ABC transporter substrate-binding protein [Bordetella hinzii]
MNWAMWRPATAAATARRSASEAGPGGGPGGAGGGGGGGRAPPPPPRAAAVAQDLRIGLQEDPDVLDPHRARTYVGRIVFTSLCDKLVDLDAKLQFVPQLATSWSWSEDNKALTFKLRDDAYFHDGSKFDAAAAKANLERAMTLQDSMRKGELASVETIEAPDAQTLVLHLKRPDATLVAQLSDRAGMMLSPKSFEGDPAAVGRKPICSGPYKFVERVQNDRIVLEKFDKYYDAKSYAFARLVFLPIP